MDWNIYGMKNIVFPRKFQGRYFEIVAYNRAGEEIGRGYTTAEVIADRDKRRERARALAQRGEG